jgi:hypothetical protein
LLKKKEDESEQVEVEQKFSLDKRKCGLGMIHPRLAEITCSLE